MGCCVPRGAYAARPASFASALQVLGEKEQAEKYLKRASEIVML